MSTYLLYSQPNAAAGTLNETLLKENVDDLLTNMFPHDATLQGWFQKEDMGGNVIKQYPLDYDTLIARTQSVVSSSAAATPTQFARPEGFTPTTNSAAYPGKLTSVAEIHVEAFAVSGTDRAVNHYAITDRYAYEAFKTTRKVVNDNEMSFWWAPGTPAGGADFDSGGTTYVARQTQGLVNWCAKTGLQRTLIGLATGGAFTDGHGNDFSDTNSSALALNKQMSYCFDAGGLNLDRSMFSQNLMGAWRRLGGDPDGSVCFTGTKPKFLFSTFAVTADGLINTREIPAAERSVVDTVDVYRTDHGVHFVNLSRYLDISGQSETVTQTSGSKVIPFDEVFLAVQPRYFRILVLRGIGYAPLAKQGDFDQGMIVSEMALGCKNPLGVAGVTNCVA